MSTEGYFMTVESTNTRPASGISRRRLVQGAAWATPAVLIATASPPAAASVTGANLTRSGTTAMTITVTPTNVLQGAYLDDIEVTITTPTHSNSKHATTASFTDSSGMWSLNGSGSTWLLTFAGPTSVAVTAPEITFTVHSAATGAYSASLSAVDQDGDKVTASA